MEQEAQKESGDTAATEPTSTVTTTSQLEEKPTTIGSNPEQTMVSEEQNMVSTTTTAGPDFSGVSAVQGARKRMEDRDVVVDDFNRYWKYAKCETPGVAVRDRHSFYAVFDGHDGVLAAEYAAERICQYATAAVDFSVNPLNAFANALRRIDKEFLEVVSGSSLHGCFSLFLCRCLLTCSWSYSI